MKTATTKQCTKINQILNNFGINEAHLNDTRANIIYNFTEGRTKSSKALTFGEAQILITNLSGFDPTVFLKDKIFSLAYQAGIIYGNTSEDKKMNIAKLNMFLKNHGNIKKELENQGRFELMETIQQIECMTFNVEKLRDSKNADRAVKELLTEYKITVK